MGLAKLKPYLLIEDYLAGENDGAVRHEYIYGEVYAMAGSSDRHNQICGNFYVKLFPKVSGSKKCRVFMTDMKLQADEATFYYPDVFVACDNPDRYFRREAILVVEVLSPSTETIDKREKLKVYRQISSMREYLIVAQDKMLVEFHQKQADGGWQKQTLTDAGEMLTLDSVDLRLSLAEIYQNVDFD